MKIFSWNKKKKIKKNKEHICSICLDNCNLIFCNKCNNYVHLECIKKYINSDYKSIILNNKENILVKCFICKRDTNFKLTKNRFNYIFNNIFNNILDRNIESTTNNSLEIYYLKYISFIINIMIYNKTYDNIIIMELLLQAIKKSKFILYDKIDVLREKLNEKLINYKKICNYSPNLKLVNYILNN